MAYPSEHLVLEVHPAVLERLCHIATVHLRVHAATDVVQVLESRRPRYTLLVATIEQREGMHRVTSLVEVADTSRQ